MSGTRNSGTPHVYGGSAQLRGNTPSSNAGPSNRVAGTGTAAVPTTPSTGAAAPSRDSGSNAEAPSACYARLSQRKKDTGGNPYPPPPPIGSYSGLQNTSVNIANAFKAATSGRGGVVTGGRREDFPGPEADQEEEGEADAEENRVADEDDLYEDGAPAAQSSVPPKAPSSAGRKRKVSVPDLTELLIPS